MKDSTVTTDPVLELSLSHARLERHDMALWLAVEVLMTHDMALADEDLQEHLLALQDRLEAKARAAYSPDSGHEQPGQGRPDPRRRPYGTWPPGSTDPGATG